MRISHRDVCLREPQVELRTLQKSPEGPPARPGNRTRAGPRAARDNQGTALPFVSLRATFRFPRPPNKTFDRSFVYLRRPCSSGGPSPGHAFGIPGSLVPRETPFVTLGTRLIPLSCCLVSIEARTASISAIGRAAPRYGRPVKAGSKVVADIFRGGIDGRVLTAIIGRLIAVGCSLIERGHRLIGVRPCLIDP